MLTLIKPKKVKLFFGSIFSSHDIYLKTKRIITKKYGPIDFESQVLDFKYTDYYQEEMGSSLSRSFLSFKKLIEPEEMVEVKLSAIRIEKKFAILNKRRINLDPGYLNESKLVLSTTKDFSHRLYLDKNIYAEVTLIYQNRGYRNLPWTYPDFKNKSYKEIFLAIRTLYKNQLKKTPSR